MPQKSMTAFPQHSSAHLPLCLAKKKKLKQVMNKWRLSKRWQNSHFWHNYDLTRRHIGAVGSAVASQQEGYWFEPQLGQLAFLCGLPRVGVGLPPTVQRLAL